MERTWIVPATAEGSVDRAEMHQLFGELEMTLFRLGGALYIAADREVVGESDGTQFYRTRRYLVQWRSFVPPKPPEPSGESDEDDGDG